MRPQIGHLRAHYLGGVAPLFLFFQLRRPTPAREKQHDVVQLVPDQQDSKLRFPSRAMPSYDCREISKEFSMSLSCSA
jgi:hypothetical protein